MREIKFRAWVNYRGKEMFADNVCVHDDGSWGYQIKVGDNTDGCFPSKDDVLEQYTGLKDKHGVEIYEGDKIKYSNSMEWGLGDIEFFCHCIGVMWTEQHTTKPSIFTPLYYLGCSKEIEVIGNIHETTK